MDKNVNRPRHKLTVELIIMIVIAGLMIFLIHFADAKLNEIMTADQQALLINQNSDNPINVELSEEIVKYRPETCKLIEVYNSNYEPMFDVQFGTSIQDTNPITDYPELIDILENSPEGHTEFTQDDQIEYIQYQWVSTSDDEQALIIIYMTKPIVKNLWVFSFICYLILILVFVIIIRMNLINSRNRIRQYNHASMHMHNML